MKITDLLKISGRHVFRQYRKNIGVILIIILGTAGLIVVFTMGKSVEENISSDLEIIGNATRLRIIFKSKPASRIEVDNREFRPETLHAIRKIPGVSKAGMIVVKNGYAKLINNDSISHFSLFGVSPSFWEVHGSQAIVGRLLNDEDLNLHLAVCVLGPRTAMEIFGTTDVVDRFVSVDKNMLRIVGVLDRISMPDKVRGIFLPLTTAIDRVRSISPANKIYIRCRSWDDVDNVKKAIPLVVNKLHPDENIEILLPEEILARVKAIAFGVKIFVQLAVVSTLLLGGFGIWNIMMMSVGARTREIGLKKAIGAEDHDILYQFLCESLMLSTSSMLLGFFLGWGGVVLTSSILNEIMPKELFLLSVMIAFFFSLALGIVAGIAPAVRASRLEVVTALRYE